MAPRRRQHTDSSSPALQTLRNNIVHGVDSPGADIRKALEAEPAMREMFLTWVKIAARREELAAWVFIMSRRRIWEDLGHKTWADYVLRHYPHPKELRKARNAWDHLRRYHAKLSKAWGKKRK